MIKHGYLVPAAPIRIGNQKAHAFTLGHPLSDAALLESPKSTALRPTGGEAPIQAVGGTTPSEG